MLTTDSRFVQAQDPTIGRRRAVTPAAYLAPCVDLPSNPITISIATSNATATAWAMTGRKETKVDFHDRWPLHPTS